MKCLFDLSYIRYNLYAGVSKYAYRILDYIVKNDKCDEFILLLNFISAPKIREWYPQFEYRVISSGILKPIPILRTLALIYKFRKIANKTNCDVIFCPWGNEITCLKANKKKISVIHDLQLRIDLKGLLLYIHKTIDDNIIRNSDKIVTISEFSKLQIRSFYPSLSDDTIVNLGNSVSTNNSNGQCLVDEKYILYVGRICKMKNVITLVKAYITIKERLAGIKLVLVGKKTQYWYEHVLPIVDECCCNDIVIIEDCTELQLTSLYKNTELFVFPSLREGFGSPPIEAAIECVPVLSTNCDSLDEVLMGQVYTYNPPTNEDALSKKILDIINNKPNRQKLEAIRDKYLSCYSIDVVGKKIYGYLKKNANTDESY